MLRCSANAQLHIISFWFSGVRSSMREWSEFKTLEQSSIPQAIESSISILSLYKSRTSLTEPSLHMKPRRSGRRPLYGPIQKQGPPILPSVR
jgi:hypothetical protein